MSKLKKIAAFLAPLAFAPQVYAQDFNIDRPEGFEIENLGTMISGAIAIALIVAGVLVFAFLVLGGIQWIMSGGDKAKTEEARSRITAALVGLAIVAAAWAVMQLIQYFFGIDIENPTIPTGY